MIIDVVIRNRIKNLDQLSYYCEHTIPAGCRVEVMLNQHKLIGFVVGSREDEPTPYKLTPVTRVIDDSPILSPLFLSLFEMLQTYTLDSKYDILQQCLPFDKRLNDKELIPTFKRFYTRSDQPLNQRKSIHPLMHYQSNERIDESQVTSSQCRTWLKQGYLVEHFELPQLNQVQSKPHPQLNEEQRVIVDDIDITQFDVHVIKGPTGSGKTHVFMACAQKVIDLNKRILLCVPEISLTPQMVERFQSYFEVPVIVYHSTLTPKEKVSALAQIRHHTSCIVIATRSGIFIDVEFGLIIIDEEHDASFYQTTPMVYHTHDIAKFIAKKGNIPLFLASATLSLETYAKALKGLYRLHSLHTRHEASFPNLHIVNMRDDIKLHQSYMISKPLFQAIDQRLQKKEQVLILMNRRGAFPTITCTHCLNNARCSECGLHLNYHSDTKKIHCHYCAKVFHDYQCVHCGHQHFTGSGYGTQSVVSRLRSLFPHAHIQRLDSDVATSVESTSILQEFTQGSIDILVGTSLISKGLDIENVTCVGILDADQALSFLNLRSSESTFAMLMQAAGRSGRAQKQGEVFIQVMDPQHRVIQCLQDHNYERFFKEEMAFRYQNQLPPYVYLISIECAHKHAQTAFEVALNLSSQLKESMHVIGPSSLLKQRGLTRYQIIIKTKDWIKTMQQLRELNIMAHPQCEMKVIANPYALGGL
jgi:primosomal protein N' (replication factor Y) (superfamily II helicase)